ncbi:MAG: hypothetical protein CML56_08590 [Rhodobacteraceae bacterium]|nr:hypothetical protein [Paracoccaceae bacterium]
MKLCTLICIALCAACGDATSQQDSAAWDTESLGACPESLQSTMPDSAPNREQMILKFKSSDDASGQIGIEFYLDQ